MMKLLFLALSLCYLALPLYGDRTLERAEAKFKKEVAKIEKDYREDLEDAQKDMLKEYDKAIERAMKKMDLESANAITAKKKAMEEGGLAVGTGVEGDSQDRKANISLISKTKVDPSKRLVGQWRWFNRRIFDFAEDGTVSGLRHTTWSYDKGKDEFTLSWYDGRMVDTLKMSADGKSLEGTNSRGQRISATRLEN